jgi:protein-S-isoprenylcysteine O-methyltransferase Ste14
VSANAVLTARRRWRAGNIPVPEAHLLGIALAIGLHLVRPASLPGTRTLHRVGGAGLLAAGIALAARSVVEAGDDDLSRPGRLLTRGPYALSRNPMYVAWTALHLGAGVIAGSAWSALTVPLAAALVHGEVRGEERSLAAAFGSEYETYRRRVARYLGVRALRRARRSPRSGSETS